MAMWDSTRVEQLIQRHKLNTRLLAELCEVNPMTVHGWRHGRKPIKVLQDKLARVESGLNSGEIYLVRTPMRKATTEIKYKGS